MLDSNHKTPLIFGESKRPLALLIQNSLVIDKNSLQFVTDENANFQVGIMSREKGYIIQEHIHLETTREIQGTSEAIFIRKGICKVSFYDSEEYSENRYELLVAQGDVIVFFRGGHKFEMIEDCEILEIKQGPFFGNLDKIRVQPDE